MKTLLTGAFMALYLFPVFAAMAYGVYLIRYLPFGFLRFLFINYAFTLFLSAMTGQQLVLVDMTVLRGIKLLLTLFFVFYMSEFLGELVDRSRTKK